MILILLSLCSLENSVAFVALERSYPLSTGSASSRLRNEYDDWRSDAVAPVTFLDEDNVQHCLRLFIDSDYGTQMFGCHERASSIGISGELTFVELAGPEVTLSLSGKFWHRRETVLGRAAMWLHACIPEIVQVNAADLEEIKDFEEVKDEVTGEVIFVKDKRAADFNGDRTTMEYQGMDPDMRGPFPVGAMSSSGSMINPV
jgi:hypothetical protein